MDNYLIKYKMFGEPRELFITEKEGVKKFIDDRKNLVEFNNFKVYKLCNDEFLD